VKGGSSGARSEGGRAIRSAPAGRAAAQGGAGPCEPSDADSPGNLLDAVAGRLLSASGQPAATAWAWDGTSMASQDGSRTLLRIDPPCARDEKGRALLPPPQPLRRPRAAAWYSNCAGNRVTQHGRRCRPNTSLPRWRGGCSDWRARAVTCTRISPGVRPFPQGPVFARDRRCPAVRSCLVKGSWRWPRS
jgi:hypothetical protein